MAKLNSTEKKYLSACMVLEKVVVYTSLARSARGMNPPYEPHTLYGSIVPVVLKILVNIFFVFVCMSTYTHTRYTCIPGSIQPKRGFRSYGGGLNTAASFGSVPGKRCGIEEMSS